MRTQKTIENKLRDLKYKEEEILNKIETLKLKCEWIPQKTILKKQRLNHEISLLKWVLNV